ncbi:MAG TPA: hypothetical protein DCY07_02070 [Rhodospirillaceae bacterium]|nr:hypothetical protein [Rhodospirillaceae bacterium]
MYSAMVLGSWLEKQRAAVKVEVLCPKKNVLALLCAIAEYRQNGGPPLPVTFYFDPSRCSKKDPKDFLDALRSGHYAVGAYPFTKRQLRIGRPMYNPEWYFSG